jgi:hypothetical protein
MSEYLEALFPNLRTTPFRVTSPADRKYNCIAWAANDATNWWWPEGTAPDAIWPGSAAREVTLSAFTAAFSTIGYVVGGDESLEPGFEKVVCCCDRFCDKSHTWLLSPAGADTLRGGCRRWCVPPRKAKHLAAPLPNRDLRAAVVRRPEPHPISRPVAGVP